MTLDGAGRWQQFPSSRCPACADGFFGVTLSVIGGLQIRGAAFIPDRRQRWNDQAADDRGGVPVPHGLRISMTSAVPAP